MWPQPRRTNSRAVAGTSRGRATSRSCSGQASVSGTRISRQPGEPPGAHAGVGRLEAGRVGVGAHEPQRGLVRDALRVRDRPAERRAPPALAAQQRAAAPGRSARASSARGRALGQQRLRPQPGGRDRRHRAGVAGERELERHPAAERVARDVRPVEPSASACAWMRARASVARASTGASPRSGGDVAEARHVDRDHVALGGEPVEHRVPHVAVGAERVDEHERRAAPATRVSDHAAASTAAVSAAEPPATAAVFGAAPSGRPRAAGERRGDVAQVAGDARGQPRLQRRAASARRRSPKPCSAISRAAERRAARPSPGRPTRPEPRLRDLVRRDEQRRAVGDAEARARRPRRAFMRRPRRRRTACAGASAVARWPRQRGLASTICTLPIRRSVKPASQKRQVQPPQPQEALVVAHRREPRPRAPRRSPASAAASPRSAA